VRLSCSVAIPHGVAEDLLVLAHRFDSDMIAGLVHTGLARARREIVEAGGAPIEVIRNGHERMTVRRLTEPRPSATSPPVLR